MASVNRVTLIGNLGRDPEMRYLPSGEAVATFSIATTEQWKDKAGNKQERTDWHRIEFIGRTAEVCGEYLKKGQSVYVEGRMQYDRYTDRSGVEKTSAKVRGERMDMLGGRSRGDAERGDAHASESTPPTPPPPTPTTANGEKGTPQPQARPRTLDDLDDDIPF